MICVWRDFTRSNAFNIKMNYLCLECFVGGLVFYT